MIKIYYTLTCILANSPGLVVKLNIVDLNRQAKMFSQGMAPVYRIIPGKLHWERVKDKPTYTVSLNKMAYRIIIILITIIQCKLYNEIQRTECCFFL